MKVHSCLAVVTGASSGIGAAVARSLGKKGARVLLLARTPESLAAVVRDIEVAGGSAYALPVDLTDPAATAAVIARIRREHGAPQLLVNNVGVGRWLFLEETPGEEAEQMIALPYLAALRLTRAFLPDMLRQRRGHIVNLTSPAAFIPIPGATAYVASRWAVRGFHEALAMDLGGSGVGVTLVAPGVVSETGYFANNPGTEERLPGVNRFIPTISAAGLGDRIVRAIERQEPLLITPWSLRLIVSIHRLLPGLVEWVVRITGTRRGVA